jgi:hypothetical protein
VLPLENGLPSWNSIRRVLPAVKPGAFWSRFQKRLVDNAVEEEAEGVGGCW